jgi:hypothetical protein
LIGKSIILLARIALDEVFLRPTVIIPRKTVDVDLVLMGVTSEKVNLKSQVHGFVNGTIFDFWFEQPFLQELARRREAFQ